MAYIDKILFDSDTYNLTDSGAARINHTHTYNELSGVAPTNHTHATQIELNNTQGNANIQLAYNTKYTLKTGGTTYTFKMPIASTGTVTSLTMNNVSKTPDSNGVIDLGTVITSLPTIPTVPESGNTATAITHQSSSGGSATTWSKSDHQHNITGSTITSALGYTPYNSTNPNEYTKNIITLNGTTVASPSFYAPTTAGTNGYYLKSNGSGAPSWTEFPTIPGDTKNTAGSTDTNSKIYLIGATSQATNPQTYSHDTAYVGTDGKLYSANQVVLVDGKNASSSVTISPKTTTVYSMTSTGSVTAGTKASFTRGTFSQGTLPTMTWAMDTTDTKKLNITFSQGTLPTHAADSFTANTPTVVTLPSRSDAINAWTGYNSATANAQTFTGITG